MSDQYVADDERDAILDRLLNIPDNKVTPSGLSFGRCASTARARTQSGHPLTSASFSATSAPQYIETWESTSLSSGTTQHFLPPIPFSAFSSIRDGIV